MPSSLSFVIPAPAAPAADKLHSDRGVRERRSSPRTECEIPVTTRRLGRAEPPAFGAMIRDASEHGIGLLVPRAYQIGSTVVVWLAGQNPRDAIRVEVVRCRREASGWFHGCKRLGERDLAP